MSKSVEITLDAAALARVEAYASLKRRTLAELVHAYLRQIGDGLVDAALPHGAGQSHLLMHRHAGRDLTASYLAGGAWDEFERPLPGLVYNWVRQHPGVVVDGGANTGFYALVAANAAPDAAVLAFEPDPLVRGLLRANIDVNGLAARITVSEAALSDTDGTAPLFVPPGEHGFVETSSSLDGRFKDRHAQALMVPTTTLDSVTEADGREVSLVKLDLGGHEFAALRGAERTVARHRPAVVVEALEHADFAGFTSFLLRHNYVDVPLRNDPPLTAQAVVTWEKDAWNHAFVPAEKLLSFLVLARGET